MKGDDRIRLQHMLDASNAVIRFAEKRIREELDHDDMLRFALLHAIQIMGEAASKISPEMRERSPQIPWSAIIGMRNRLVHAYFDVDPDILWTTATEAIPELLPHIEALLGTK